MDKAIEFPKYFVVIGDLFGDSECDVDKAHLLVNYLSKLKLDFKEKVVLVKCSKNKTNAERLFKEDEQLKKKVLLFLDHFEEKVNIGGTVLLQSDNEVKTSDDPKFSTTIRCLSCTDNPESHAIKSSESELSFALRVDEGYCFARVSRTVIIPCLFD